MCVCVYIFFNAFQPSCVICQIHHWRMITKILFKPLLRRIREFTYFPRALARK